DHMLLRTSCSRALILEPSTAFPADRAGATGSPRPADARQPRQLAAAEGRTAVPGARRYRRCSTPQRGITRFLAGASDGTDGAARAEPDRSEVPDQVTSSATHSRRRGKCWA